MSREQARHALAPLLVGIVVVLAYWRFVGEYFQGGDTWPHIWTTRLGSLGDVGKVLSKPIMYGTVFPDTVALFFRPLSSLSYAVDYSPWGMNPVPFHLTDVLIHVLGTLGVFWLATAFGLRRWTAAFGALVFALHPIMASVVPDLPRRHDSLAAALLLCALSVAARIMSAPHLTGRGLWAGSAAAAGLLGLAEMAKETGYLGPILLVPTLVLVPSASAGSLRTRVRRGLVVWLSFVAVSAAMLVWRWQVLGGPGGYYDQTPLLSNLDVALNDLLRNLLFPWIEWLGRTPRAWATQIGLALLVTAVPAVLVGGSVRRIVVYGWIWLVVCGVFQMLTKSLAAWQTYLTLAAFGFLVGGVVEAAAGLMRPTERSRLRAAAVLACACLVAWFVGALVSRSVLVQPFDEWQMAGDTARTYLGSLRPCLESAPPDLNIVVRDAPDSLDASTLERTMLHPGILGPYSVGPAVELVLPDLPPRPISAVALQVIPGEPRSVSTRCTAEGGDWVIRSDLAY
jgi:hypothetical protein